MRGREFIDVLDYETFVKRFLEAYLEDGLGSLPKRQIDLTVLRLLIECGKSAKGDPPSDYELARAFGVSPRKIRSMLDELAFRDEDKNEAWCRAELQGVLKGAEKLYDKGKVRFQIDDGLVRAYATSRIRNAFGIVDTSFNRAIIELSGDKYAGLVIELMDEAQREELIGAIPEPDREKHQDPERSKSAIQLFIDSFVESAGKEAGKKAIQLGVAALTGGASLAIDFVSSVISAGNGN